MLFTDLPNENKLIFIRPSWVYLGDTAASAPELPIFKQYSFAVVKKILNYGIIHAFSLTIQAQKT